MINQIVYNVNLTVIRRDIDTFSSQVPPHVASSLDRKSAGFFEMRILLVNVQVSMNY